MTKVFKPDVAEGDGDISTLTNILLENEKFFELKSREYRDGIKRKETR